MFKYLLPICITQQITACPFRVRHHPKHVPLPVANTGDAMYGSVRIVVFRYMSVFIAIPVNYLPVHFNIRERGSIGKKSALAMCNGYFKCFSALRSCFPDVHIFAYVLLVTVAQQYAGQQPAFAKYLKSVAYTQALFRLYWQIQ